MKNMVRVLIGTFLIGMASIQITYGQFFFFEMQNSMVGEKAPDFTLQTLSGKDVNMTKFRDGKKAIIFFWATWCPHCRRELTNLNRNASQLDKANIKLVLIDLGEDEKIVGAYVKKNNIHFDIFLDRKEELADSYGLVGVPTFYFVDEKGIVRDVQHQLGENFSESFKNKG